MVVSTVRTNSLGFTDDPRRINVALTRARHGLVRICGLCSMLFTARSALDTRAPVRVTQKTSPT
jgi:superfamily I DNA and/or RNA helicase